LEDRGRAGSEPGGAEERAGHAKGGLANWELMDERFRQPAEAEQACFFRLPTRVNEASPWR
jgi:hypothetical protein